MATLHVLSHSPFADSRLTSCLRLLGSKDALLLCGDATYALTQATAPLQALQSRVGAFELFAMQEDVLARNLTIPAWVKCVGYPEFVELSIRYDRVNTWL
ncbi:sulfurtransferase complex subunit TusB [Pseudomonas syringae]|uniref:Sulfur relay protein DsrH n=1 Tax=Pseudomonas syringae TaxID=317 RepID=A0A085VLA3_PSESX|nr:sulfurtransferase complex subunit TusB [Pseudomonas syringae]KFE56216.1 sulfur relay protein DsrH [Pseudomonas syringae]